MTHEAEDKCQQSDPGGAGGPSPPLCVPGQPGPAAAGAERRYYPASRPPASQLRAHLEPR